MAYSIMRQGCNCRRTFAFGINDHCHKVPSGPGGMETSCRNSALITIYSLFFVIRHSFTIEDFVSAPNLKLGCAVILRGCASDSKYIQTVLVV